MTTRNAKAQMKYSSKAGVSDPNKLYRGNNMGRPLDSQSTKDMAADLKFEGQVRIMPQDSI